MAKKVSLDIINPDKNSATGIQQTMAPTNDGVRAIEGSSDNASIWKSRIQPLNAKKQSSNNAADGIVYGEDKRKQAEESIQKVMYFNCWTQS
ncbi:hypothetical protein HS088_TW09G00275 [Tripterygium wilfordii]|uniref:Uncharacterized protein n=1 Tax=Tripterygium wilfordii TaxID=458696 RepID=A0A7J7D7E9_TRIWF|nr:hypothetical protein HS088_TW09G00275 [Tripterygium wilfordii]